MGVSENVVYPIVPNGFADQTIPFLNGYFIGNINQTFSDKPTWVNYNDLTSRPSPGNHGLFQGNHPKWPQDSGW